MNLKKRIFTVNLLFLFFNIGLYAQSTDIATSTLQENLQKFKLEERDIEDFEITHEHTSSLSSIQHIYIRQTIDFIPVFQAVGGIHIDANGNTIAFDNQFIGSAYTKINTSIPTLTAIEAVNSAADQLEYDITNPITILENQGGPIQSMILSRGGISLENIPAQLMYQPLEDGSLRLSWDISILEISAENWWSIRVDAITGEILHKYNWTLQCSFGHDDGSSGLTCDEEHKLHCDHSNHSHEKTNSINPDSYRVYALGVESPNHGSRSLEVDPANLTASPFGWHDTDGSAGAEFTITQGNNVLAQEDQNGNNGSGDSPDGGANLDFDFPIDFSQQPNFTDNENSAITNLFYWNNVIHDILYLLGFDEASGNFQENNYGNGGSGSDSVNADAQDGSGTNNANFSTPTDGSNPRMQMFLFNPAPGSSIDLDGDLDNGIIVHEYGHGISIRLTGGAGNSGCLSNDEQMGEGWSDWYGLMLTTTTSNSGPERRGVGTYALGQPVTGNGVRNQPYSTDMSINSFTYDDIKSFSVPHGVGSVWCEMLWEMTWELVAVHGWDNDYYTGTGGNNIAMQLVTEGLKLQPCSPGFIDGRDAILAADDALNGGANKCLIWNAFAKRGLGFSASQGSTGSRSDGTESFDMPPSCNLGIDKTSDVAEIAPGGIITYTLTATNSTDGTINNIVITDPIPDNATYVAGSASNGGTESGGIVTFPAVFLNTMATHTVTFQVKVDPNLVGGTYDFFDDVESGNNDWTVETIGDASIEWEISTTTPYAGTQHWFANEVSTTANTELILTDMVVPITGCELRFFHSYDTEINYDGGQVSISTDGGTSWTDLGSLMTQNGYNNYINGSSSQVAFSGNSGGYVETVVDLNSYAGQNIQVRFLFSCDFSVSGDGWYIDDIKLTNLGLAIPNTASVTADGGLGSDGSVIPTNVLEATCMDGVQNGDETDVDCGGTTCNPCSGGGPCPENDTLNGTLSVLMYNS